MVCNNQCSGRGDCWLGFCRGHPGWWGHDCAHRDPSITLPAPAGASPTWHPSGRRTAVGAETRECSRPLGKGNSFS